jgi:hypothetical protein
MATQTLSFTAPCRWAKVFEDNRDMIGPVMSDGRPHNPDIREKMEGQYTIEMLLDDDQLEELKASGSQAADYAKPEDGKHLVRFKRPHKKYNRKGELLEWACGAPEVSWDFEEDGPIGNGSTVTVTVVVYQAGPMVGTRLKSVDVVEHVPIETPDEGDDPSDSDSKEYDEVPF